MTQESVGLTPMSRSSWPPRHRLPHRFVDLESDAVGEGAMAVRLVHEHLAQVR